MTKLAFVLSTATLAQIAGAGFHFLDPVNFQVTYRPEGVTIPSRPQTVLSW